MRWTSCPSSDRGNGGAGLGGSDVVVGAGRFGDAAEEDGAVVGNRVGAVVVADGANGVVETVGDPGDGPRQDASASNATAMIAGRICAIVGHPHYAR
jgi:hypothetical protein